MLSLQVNLTTLLSQYSTLLATAYAVVLVLKEKACSDRSPAELKVVLRSSK